MIEIDIRELVPRFLRKDKNGGAIAAAIEAAMRYTAAQALTGLNLVADTDTMPEWRLDEMAWELNCLYDYRAGAEQKRRWIKHSIPIYRIYGTPRAIINYLEGMFDQVEVEENLLYGGDPFHFQVTLTGEWTDEKEAWARRAADVARNVRSVLDAIAVGSHHRLFIGGSGEAAAGFSYGMTGDGLLTGTLPQDNMAGGLAEVMAAARGIGEGNVFPYPKAGTQPDINTVAGLAEGSAEAAIDQGGSVYPYTMCGTLMSGE